MTVLESRFITVNIYLYFITTVQLFLALISVSIDKGRGPCVSESYQNYQNGAVSNQLTDAGRGVGMCWG
jgi:hypothetical protein